MALSSDVRDILEVDSLQPSGSSGDYGGISLELFGTSDKKKVMKRPTQSLFKRPEGMHRELFALLYTDSKEVPPLAPVESPLKLGGYKSVKARLTMARKVRPWQWNAFRNTARTDELMLHHWCRSEDCDTAYPFAKFNKVLEVPSYDEDEYRKLLSGSVDWSKEETDHLMELCVRFDLRWYVVHDRWNRDKFSTKRSVEDLKERYYDVFNILSKARAKEGEEVVLLNFDAAHERKRKEQLEKLYHRTPEQIAEEEFLVAELRKIEARKKERERKAQDLQKLITAADSADKTTPSAVAAQTPDKKKKLGAPKAGRPSLAAASSESLTSLESSGIRWNETRGPGIFLRSHRMKLPGTLGQKKVKAIEQLLQQFSLEANPMATEEICEEFNALRSDFVLLFELRAALATCQYELESLKHQYFAMTGKELSVPAKLRPMLEEAESAEGSSDASPIKKKLDEILDTTSTTTPSRKRRAALEQSQVLKTLRKT